MNTKGLSTVFVLLISGGVFSQPKVFLYEEIQTRNKKQQWENTREIYTRAAWFYADSIEVMADRFYRLAIVTITKLPDDGFVFLCKDQNQNDITVTLIGDDRLFLYDGQKRLLINFKHFIDEPVKASALANVQD